MQNVRIQPIDFELRVLVRTKRHIAKCFRCVHVFESITRPWYLTYSSYQENTVGISDSRPIVRQVKRPCMTFNFQVVRIITHKMAYRTAYMTSIWGHNLSILACMQLYSRKGRSLILVQSFGVRFIHIHLLLFELCLREKKKKKKERRRRTKSTFLHQICLTVRRSNATLGLYFK